jgi:hypothetical protein
MINTADNPRKMNFLKTVLLEKNVHMLAVQCLSQKSHFDDLGLRFRAPSQTTLTEILLWAYYFINILR